MKQSSKYMELMNLSSPEEAYRQVKKLASSLSDDEHLIRSCIFDLHAAVEVELKRIYYHVFKNLLFLTDDEKHNQKVIENLDKMVSRLGFMDMYRVLKPILNSWPYPDLESISSINETRSKAAHGGDITKVTYQNRNPFTDPDAFAQMYFDVWAIKQEIAKFFYKTIERPIEQLRKYYKEYGDI